MFVILISSVPASVSVSIVMWEVQQSVTEVLKCIVHHSLWQHYRMVRVDVNAHNLLELFCTRTLFLNLHTCTHYDTNIHTHTYTCTHMRPTHFILDTYSEIIDADILSYLCSNSVMWVLWSTSPSTKQLIQISGSNGDWVDTVHYYSDCVWYNYYTTGVDYNETTS